MSRLNPTAVYVGFVAGLFAIALAAAIVGVAIRIFNH